MSPRGLREIKSISVSDNVIQGAYDSVDPLILASVLASFFSSQCHWHMTRMTAGYVYLFRLKYISEKHRKFFPLPGNVFYESLQRDDDHKIVKTYYYRGFHGYKIYKKIVLREYLISSCNFDKRKWYLTVKSNLWISEMEANKVHFLSFLRRVSNKASDFLK